MTHPAWIHPPLLRPGDRMPLAEFLDRWNQMPELKFAELIDGIVYMASPVSRHHMRSDGRIQALCGYYSLRTPGVDSGTNGTWLMTPSSAPQPDCSVWIKPECGGRTTTRDGLAAGSPDLVCEISYSSRSYDLGPKLALYQLAEVPEYLAILVEEQRFEWRTLVNGSYGVLAPDASGVYRSQALPGLWINEPAFWAEDSAALLQTLELGLASPDHAAFAADLQTKL